MLNCDFPSRFPSMRRYFEEEDAEAKRDIVDTAAAVSGIATAPGFSQSDMANGELGRTDGIHSKHFRILESDTQGAVQGFKTGFILEVGVTGWEAKRLKGCVFMPPSLLPVPGRGK